MGLGRGLEIVVFRRGHGFITTFITLRTFRIWGHFLVVSGSTGPQAPPPLTAPPWPLPDREGEAGSQGGPQAAAPPAWLARRGPSAPPFPHLTSLQALPGAGRSPGTCTPRLPWLPQPTGWLSPPLGSLRQPWPRPSCIPPWDTAHAPLNQALTLVTSPFDGSFSPTAWSGAGDAAGALSAWAE